MGTYRLILALLVAISHMGVSIFGVNEGVIAVISFLMISGFVMTALINGHYRNAQDIPAFYLDRLLRLQPQYLFYLALTLTYFFTVGIDDPLFNSATLESIILNVLIIPANFYMTETLNARVIIPPAWSLGLEACFYLTIPILVAFRLRHLALVISLIIFLFAYSTVIDTNLFGYRFLPGTLFMFLLGSFLCDAGRHGKLIILSTYSLCCSLLAATIIFNTYRVPYNIETLLGVALGLPIIYLLKKRKYGKLDQTLGNISYGVFLNHFLLLWIWKELGLSISSPSQMTALIMTSITLAWASYQFIEKPAIQIRKDLRRSCNPNNQGQKPSNSGRVLETVSTAAGQDHILPSGLIENKDRGE